MAGNRLRRVDWLSLAIAVASVAGPQAQTLRTLTGDHQDQAPVQSVCGGGPIYRPASQPPSGPVVFLVALCFDPVGSQSRFEPERYLHQIHLKRSAPSKGDWVPFDEDAERTIFEDHLRLTGDPALTGVSIEISDYRFTNGTIGKVVSFHLTEKN